MEIFATVVTGVSVFVLGKLIEQFVIEPIHSLKKEVSEIQNFLVENQNCLSPNDGPTVLMREVGEHFSKLKVIQNTVPAYSLWAFLKFVPKESTVNVGYRLLYRLYHSLEHDRDEKYQIFDELTDVFDVPYVTSLDPERYQ